MQAFTVEDLIACYRRGVFPMAETRGDEHIYLVDPELRGVIPLQGFHVPRRLGRLIRAERFQIKIDSAFREVVSQCARPRPGRRETWISRPIQDLYQDLFLRGHAHSLETWRDGELVGGLYGVSIGRAFFGESMFSTERDASKTALVHLVARLKAGGYGLLDAQFMTEHLAQFGTHEIPRADYLDLLDHALQAEGDFYALSASSSGEAVMQAIGHS